MKLLLLVPKANNNCTEVHKICGERKLKMHKLKNMIELDKIVFPIPINRIYFDKLYFDKTITTDRIERYKLNKKYVKGILK